MKKKVLIPLAVVATLSFVSCDTKACYCFESTPQGVYQNEVYVNADLPCSSMNTDNTGCIEANERGTMENPGGNIAYK